MRKKGLTGSVLSLIFLPVSTLVIFYFSLILGVIAGLQSGSLSNADIFISIMIFLNVAISTFVWVLHIVSITIFCNPEQKFKKKKWVLITCLVLQFIIICLLLLLILCNTQITAILILLITALVLLISNILYIVEYTQLNKLQKSNQTDETIKNDTIPQDLAI